MLQLRFVDLCNGSHAQWLLIEFLKYVFEFPAIECSPYYPLGFV